MLAHHHPSPTYMSSAYNAFLPTIPSPLSPRSANVGAQPFRFSMSSPTAQGSENAKEKTVVFAKRAVKKAPSPSSDELKERRRNNFLQRVARERDEKRFEVRGEDMQRLEFYRLQRAWEAQQAQAAPMGLWDAMEEEEAKEEAELPQSSWAGSVMHISQQLEDEVDEVQAREDEEVAALLEFMPDGEQMDQREADESSEHLWSDDEDYDALFSELMAQVQAEEQQQQQTSTHAAGAEAMDTS